MSAVAKTENDRKMKIYSLYYTTFTATPFNNYVIHILCNYIQSTILL